MPHAFAGEDDDEDVRLNPMLEQTPTQQTSSMSYSFINRAANHITMNDHSWRRLAEKFEKINNEGHCVRIVHIGDSHIQAEGNTSQVRKHLQQRYGNGGRGLIIPFRIAGTNQPLDYKLSSSTPLTSAKLLKTPWTTKMGFTGISLAAPQSPFTLSLSVEQPFIKLIIHGSGNIDVTSVHSNGHNIAFVDTKTPDGTAVILDEKLTSVQITITAPGANIYGIELLNNTAGVVYSAIGNNGATFASYTQIPDMGRGVATLHPDLVILALGTNEAFGKMSDATFYNTIRALINEIKQYNPHAEFLLVTPSECQRSVYSTVRTGRRKRRRTRRIRNFAVNTNVARMAEVIRKYGIENDIPVYDFYKVAGGSGASDHWAKNRLLSGDRIHRTWSGYRLEGDLLYDALVHAIDNPSVAEHSKQQETDQKVSNAFASHNSEMEKDNISVTNSDNDKKSSSQVKNKQKTKPNKKVKSKAKKSKKKKTKRRRRR